MLVRLPKQQKPSYEDFYRANHDRVFYYVRSRINSPEDAEDLTSEIFLYCYTHYDDYDPEKSNMMTWLYLIANSRIKNFYRDHQATYVDYEAISQTLQDLDIDLDKGIYLEQLHSALMDAIQTLPERQRKIIILYYFENRSGEEIARQLNISPGNVRVLLTRALDKLSAFHNAYWKEFKNNG